ncbi:MAG: 50S ribosomal protein L30 [Candidatus Marinimicrobia bacterium]|nr:50S ribosomal protein L30 [Candidatus Neomarinimicrobiota bacterium]
MSKQLKITQMKSTIKRHNRQKKTLKALGLKGRHDSVVQPDNPSIRGMIKSVSHLLKVEEVE